MVVLGRANMKNRLFICYILLPAAVQLFNGAALPCVVGTTLTFAAPCTCESRGYLSAPATPMALDALVSAWQ